MYRRICLHEFAKDMLRHSSFTYEGVDLLFDYISNVEEETGEEIEFDPATLRGQFAQFPSVKKAIESGYSPEYIEDNTVAQSDTCIIVKVD